MTYLRVLENLSEIHLNQYLKSKHQIHALMYKHWQLFYNMLLLSTDVNQFIKMHSTKFTKLQSCHTFVHYLCTH
jgi:hypothetical protein